MPVEARGKLFCSFPRSGGRALFASTAPTASTGSSSVAHLPNGRTRDVAMFAPRMIGRRVMAPTWTDRGLARRARGRFGRPDAGRGASPDLGQARLAVAVPNLTLHTPAF